MTARVVARTPLLYADGADPTLDRPGHVRAGSALVSWPGHLAVVQDDASFLAVIDRRTMRVRDIAFPGSDVRQFDDSRGNKKAKLDLEAAFVIGGGGLLVAMGSGSSEARERFVFVEDPGGARPRVSVHDMPSLYDKLRKVIPGELNIEGAVVHGNDLMLFQRGNGKGAVNMTVRMELAPLLSDQAPKLRVVNTWELPRGLTFTDAVLGRDDTIMFLACAEDSPDAMSDGPVKEVAIGRLDEARHVIKVEPILDEHGAPLLEKVEGIALDPDDPSRVFVVTDRDDATVPSDLLVLALD